jgi:hypothetical protein
MSLLIDCEEDRTLRARARRDVGGKRGHSAEHSQGWRHNEQVDAPGSPDVRDLARRMGANRAWDEDSRAIASWMLTWQRIALDVAIVSGLVMLALLVYTAWERLSR